MRVVTGPISTPVALRHGPFSTSLVIQEGLLPDEVVQELRNALELEFLPYPRAEQHPSQDRQDEIIAAMRVRQHSEAEAWRARQDA